MNAEPSALRSSPGPGTLMLPLLGGVMLGLRRVYGGRLSRIRVAMEATALVAGWILGGSVGVGTVITGLLIGPGIQFWLATIANTNRGIVHARAGQ